jgi:Mg-chelatase subunit ChlD
MKGTAPHRVAIAALLAWGLGSAAGAEDRYGVRIHVETPEAGSLVRSRTDMAPLAGVASADGARPAHFDVMIVVDVSGSTKYPSGVDVDEDGEIGETRTALMAMLPDVPNTDPDDSVLAAEVQAANALIDGLNAQRVRVGVVSFSGEVDPDTGRRKSPDQQDAFLEHPLTNDFQAVRRALEAVKLRGASGGTNMEAGLKLAVQELAGLPGAQSRPKRGAKPVVLLLTDGKPSLPYGLANAEDEADIESVIDAARLAKTAGVLINSYGLGPVAIDYPIAATEMARVTGGVYTPVRRPGDIVSLLSGVTFANVEDVVAVNLTLGEMAGPDDVLLLPDGSFSGFVPVRQGTNRIRISALASDGSRGSTELEFEFKHQDLTDAELQAELARVRRRNRELQMLMERKRQEEFRKRERERLLEIEVEDEGNQP